MSNRGFDKCLMGSPKNEIFTQLNGSLMVCMEKKFSFFTQATYGKVKSTNGKLSIGGINNIVSRLIMKLGILPFFLSLLLFGGVYISFLSIPWILAELTFLTDFELSSAAKSIVSNTVYVMKTSITNKNLS